MVTLPDTLRNSISINSEFYTLSELHWNFNCIFTWLFTNVNSPHTFRLLTFQLSVQNNYDLCARMRKTLIDLDLDSVVTVTFVD